MDRTEVAKLSLAAFLAGMSLGLLFSMSQSEIADRERRRSSLLDDDDDDGIRSQGFPSSPGPSTWGSPAIW